MWRKTDSDVEALILEAELIKKYLPEYNVLMRDDKQYLYVGFTKEKFPKIFFTHQLRRPDRITRRGSEPRPKGVEAKYIGPFTDAWAVRYILKSLRRAFPYCVCKETHKRPCQQAEIGRCLGVCCLENERAKKIYDDFEDRRIQYRNNVKIIKAVLSGKYSRVLKTSRRGMKMAANNKNYEEAGSLRDQIQALENIFKHRFIIKRDEVIYKNKGLEYLKNVLGLPETPKRVEAYDISNIQGKFAVGSMVVFDDGRPDKNEYRKFRIRMPNRPNDTAMIREVLSRRLNHTEWPMPDVMLIDGGKPQLNSVLSIVKPRRFNIKIIALAKREEELYLPDGKIMKLKEGPPALLHLLQHLRNEAHRFAVSYHRKRRSRLLK